MVLLVFRKCCRWNKIDKFVEWISGATKRILHLCNVLKRRQKKSNKLGYFYFSFINDCLVAYSHWHINPTGWKVCCVPPQEEKRKIENVFSCIFDDSIFFLSLHPHDFRALTNEDAGLTVSGGGCCSNHIQFCHIQKFRLWNIVWRLVVGCDWLFASLFVS